MKWEAAVFDLDGTLINSLADLASSVNRILSAGGYPPRTPDEVRQFVGNGVRRLVERALPHPVPTEELDRMFELYKKDYQQHLLDETAPYPGIVELLQTLKQSGMRLAVLSNKPHASVQRICEALFPGTFDLAWGDRSGVPRKPDPTAVWMALDAMDIPREKAVYIGDSETDIRTARNAGLHSIGVLWGFRDRDVLEAEQAQEICETAGELERLLLQ